jgi:hypothetical protein
LRLESNKEDPEEWIPKCYRCNKMGDIAANCPGKDSEAGLVTVFNTEVEAEGTLDEKRQFESNSIEERRFEGYEHLDPEGVW